MIQVIPSITIANNKVAKLGTGEFENASYFEKLSPLDLALLFQEAGATRLHLVDLDGARAQTVVNYLALQVIKGHTDLSINFSGGVRTDGGVQLALENGATSVTVATIAAEHPEVFSSWLVTFTRNTMVLGVDVTADGFIKSHGWKRKTDIRWQDMVAYFRDRGVRYVKLTDVSRDGVLQGPNFDLIKQFRDLFPEIELVTSGGVRNVEDIEKLNGLGVNYVIIARALWEDKLHLDELKPYWGIAKK